MDKIYFKDERKTLESFLTHITNKARDAGLIEATAEVKTRADIEAIVEKAKKIEKPSDEVKHVLRHCNYALNGGNTTSKKE